MNPHLDKLDWMLFWCYDQRAYFSDTNPSQMRGDDWDDAPYEHNASFPHDVNVYGVSFSVLDSVVPSTMFHNSPYSLEDINYKKPVPWLTRKIQEEDYYEMVIDDSFQLFAGVTLKDFILAVQRIGGVIYVPMEPLQIPENDTIPIVP